MRVKRIALSECAISSPLPPYTLSQMNVFCWFLSFTKPRARISTKILQTIVCVQPTTNEATSEQWQTNPRKTRWLELIAILIHTVGLDVCVIAKMWPDSVYCIFLHLPSRTPLLPEWLCRTTWNKSVDFEYIMVVLNDSYC